MSDYDHIEKVLAEIIVEVTGEPRIGRFERTVAKQALARLRECGMTMVERVTEVSEPQGEPSDAQVEAGCAAFYEGAQGLTSWARLVAGEPDLANRYRDGIRATLRAAGGVR